MRTALIIDGNYILSRNTFTLAKNNLLYGSLEHSLNMAITNYKKWYPFIKIYIVSDSREKSWRKRIDDKYKATRKKDSKIDWEFVYNTYGEFKEKITHIKNVKVLESPTIEGDDWIAYLVHNLNKRGISTVTISNDYDIKQLVNFSIDPMVMNVMSNEVMSKKKFFIPENYQIFLDKLRNDYDPTDIFSINNENVEYLQFIDKFKETYEFIEIQSMNSLLLKVISGDKSDNISSVFETKSNGKKRGIGAKGAEAILEKYIEEFGNPTEVNEDLIENIADIILEKKKLNKYEFDGIVTNIKKNISMVNLDITQMPIDIIKSMEDEFKK